MRVSHCFTTIYQECSDILTDLNVRFVRSIIFLNKNEKGADCILGG